MGKMTGERGSSDGLRLLTEACEEITRSLKESEEELPKGHIEELKTHIAETIGTEPQTPKLEKQLKEFEALYKKYTAKVHSLYEARDLARWEHYTLKLDLCEEVKKISKCSDKDLPRIARELKLIRLRWKDIGSVPHEKNEEIWNEFSEECNKLQKRIGEYYDKLEGKRQQIAVNKIKICEEAENIQSSTDWQEGTKQFKALQARWREIGFTAPEEEKKLYIRFRAACDVFFNARKEYYQQNRLEREAISSVKFQLCEEAKTIFDLSYSEAHQLIPDLWKRWKNAGSAGKNDRELYKRFRGCFDEYYENLRKQRAENLDIKKEICDGLKAMCESLESGKKQFEDIKAEYSKQKKLWDSTGAIPRSEEKAIMGRYSALIEKLNSFNPKSGHDSKNFLKRSFELEKIVSSALDSLDSKKMEMWEKCQSEWNAAKSAEKEYFSESFNEVTAAFEDGSAEHYKKLLNTFNHNLKKRKEICEELENLGIKPEEGATDADLADELTQAIAKNFGSESNKEDKAGIKDEKINRIAIRWLKAGTVPLKDLPKIYKRFEQAIENIKD
jgi:hypothetical protein